MIKPMIPKSVLKKRVKEIAERITRDYQGESITLVCILKGGIYFFADLSRQIKLDDVRLDFMCVQSYDGTDTTGQLDIRLDLSQPITGKNVIVVEDIIDTGTTLAYLMDYLMAQSPKSLKLCVLLDKKERRETETKVNYVGFESPDEFVVGYGMDYNQEYRTYPTVGVLKEDAPQRRKKHPIEK